MIADGALLAAETRNKQPTGLPGSDSRIHDFAADVHQSGFNGCVKFVNADDPLAAWQPFSTSEAVAFGFRRIAAMLTQWINRQRHRLLARRAERPFAAKRDELPYTLAAEGYSSQCGQDKWIASAAFPSKLGGVFVDIGAHDGRSLSNTLYLEQRLGWTGLAIEPNPEVYARLVRNRKCQTIHGCVGNAAGIKKFRMNSGHAEMLSGLVDQYHPRHLQRIDRELKLHGGTSREIEVRCYTLNELLEAHQMFHVDYLSIDVEGAEYSILEAFDFRRFSVAMWGIENNYKDLRIPRLLAAHGYDFCAVVGDEFYRHRQAA